MCLVSYPIRGSVDNTQVKEDNTVNPYAASCAGQITLLPEGTPVNEALKNLGPDQFLLGIAHHSSGPKGYLINPVLKTADTFDRLAVGPQMYRGQFR